MKMRKIITKMLIAIIAITMCIGTIPSIATMDREARLEARLEYERYVKGEATEIYAINGVGGFHPLFQIMKEGNKDKTNYYCLNALKGTSWEKGDLIQQTAEYNITCDLENPSEIEELLKERNLDSAYKYIVNSEYYYKQILWILSNIYVPDASKPDEYNEAKKEALLAKAGIVKRTYEEVLNNVSDDKNEVYCYDKTATDYDCGALIQYYPASPSNDDVTKTLEGGRKIRVYSYHNQDGERTSVKISDELVEVAQQAALWYFTNGLNPNATEQERERFNTYEKEVTDEYGNKHMTLGLYLTRGEWEMVEDPPGSNVYRRTVPETKWNNPLENEVVDTNVPGHEARVGGMKAEQAAILCHYLIEAANDYANNPPQEENQTEEPLTLDTVTNPSKTAEIEEKTIGNDKYFVVGPIKINKNRREETYTLNTIKVNGNANAYISDAEGNDLHKSLTDCLGTNFYITVPKAEENTVAIEFTFKYNKNAKILWMNQSTGEQPIVEIGPREKTMTLDLTATKVEKTFDLALRKEITSIKDVKGTEKLISNEEGELAERNLKYSTETLKKGTDTTATYNHRKDPVVVEKGDTVEYKITVFNEGQADGTPVEITDKLPQGLKIKGASEGTINATVMHGAEIETKGEGFIGGIVNEQYSFKYEENTKKITFTTEEGGMLHGYKNGKSLDEVTFTVECEVTQEPSTTTNTYLTNIAYISKAYNAETEQIVDPDRDSYTSRNPSATQVTTGNQYNGYKGKTSNESVYDEGANNNFYKGEEDDDDFEIVVLKPIDFDLALQKYITSVYSNGTTKPGRQEPKIDTTKLADKTSTTAKYELDKTPVRVKNGDFVTYTITVYNEGEVDGYVNKITDNIPTGLQFVYQDTSKDGKTLVVSDSKGNMKQIEVDAETYKLVGDNNACWSIDADANKTAIKDTFNGEETISITCDVASYLNGQNKLLKAYDSSKDVNNNGDGLDRTSVTVVLRVESAQKIGTIIRNEAAITEAQDTNGNIQDRTDLTDRDSQTTTWLGKDVNGEGKKEYQDDEDYDRIVLEKVDLALTKFITAVSEDITIEDGEYLTKDTTSKDAGKATNPYTRATKVDTTQLANGTKTTADYQMVKDPLTVPQKAYVLYNIRVYNEGQVDVFAGEVKDYLPNHLDYVDCEFNDKYEWKVGADGKTITTSYLSYESGVKNNTDNLLKAFDVEKDDGLGAGLDYRDLQILCRVNEKAPTETNLINSAEITKYQDENGKELKEDIDSKPENLPDEKKNHEHREEDDDDYEVVNVEKKIVDMALTKFITAVSKDIMIDEGEYLTKDGTSKNAGSSENPYIRATKVDTTELRDNEECHDAKYEMVKDPLTVLAKSYVLYNIRLYNEGQTDIYVGEVKDYLPEYLDYVDCEFNDKYVWKVGADGKTITTDYLSYESELKNKTNNLIKAFDKKTDDGAGSGLDYRDLQILCRVNDKAPTNTEIVNVAEITKYENDEGEDLDEDIDSTPENVKQKNEDDDDYEVVIIKKFDLSLLKYVTTVYVTEDGQTKTIQTGNVGDENDIIPKVEIHRKKIDSTVVKFGYTIKITNEGEIEGYAKEITDYVPEGLKFYSEDNDGWLDEGNNVISTRLLENTLLKPGESAEVTVILRWINGSNNLGLKTNTAEISEDYNDQGIDDWDSTPDNKVWGEDDIDNASVLLSISTGLLVNVVMYATAGTIILAVLGTGIMLIKKYVL